MHNCLLFAYFALGNKNNKQSLPADGSSRTCLENNFVTPKVGKRIVKCNKCYQKFAKTLLFVPCLTEQVYREKSRDLTKIESNTEAVELNLGAFNVVRKKSIGLQPCSTAACQNHEQLMRMNLAEIKVRIRIIVLYMLSLHEHPVALRLSQ